MHYLIDGYNFAHRAGLFGQVLEQVRDRVVKRVSPLAGGGNRVTVVWDARHPPTGQPSRVPSGSVDQVFARSGRSADQEIVERVRNADRPSALIVVSDDLDIVKPARDMGAQVRSVAETLKRVTPPAEHLSKRPFSREDDSADEKKTLRLTPEENAELLEALEDGWVPPWERDL